VVLDLGMGYGYIAYNIAKRCKKLIGIDKDFKLLNFSRDRNWHPNITYVNADLKEGIPIKKGSYTACVLSHVLEHLDDPISLLKELDCKKILIIIPCEENWLNWIRKELGLKIPYTSDHRYEYTKEYLIEILKKSGLKIKRIEYTNLGNLFCFAQKS
jgi:SAM-dependent methyltransferase